MIKIPRLIVNRGILNIFLLFLFAVLALISQRAFSVDGTVMIQFIHTLLALFRFFLFFSPFNGCFLILLFFFLYCSFS